MNPDVDGSRAGAGRFTRIFTTRAKFVDVVLGDACRNHRKSGRDKSPSNLLQWREADSYALEAWIDQSVANGDEDDESDGVYVVDEIVRGAMEFHGCGLGDQVICHLVICEPVHRIPEENSTGFETSANFIHPDVVKGHPSRFV